MYIPTSIYIWTFFSKNYIQRLGKVEYKTAFLKMSSYEMVML